MNKKLVKFMEESNDYRLENVKTCEPVLSKSKLIRPLQILFLVVTIVMLLEFFDVINVGMNFVTYFLSIVFLIIFPLASQKENKKELLYITPDYFIQRMSGKDFVAVKYNEVTSFSLDDKGIVICSNDVKITLSMSMFKEYLEIVVDILEAFGKTFDKQKDYMKRPVEIIIDGDEVNIIDLKQEIPHFEHVAGALVSKFEMLTPGFIDEIILKNAIVEKASTKKKDLHIQLSHFEVKPGHPENVSFDPIIVEDCILVFEAPVINLLAKRETNTRTSEYVELKPSIIVLNKNILKGVISEWKYNDGSIDLFIGVGVSTIKANISYKDVLIGWNKQR